MPELAPHYGLLFFFPVTPRWSGGTRGFARVGSWKQLSGKHDKTEACFWSRGRIYGVCSVMTPKSPSHAWEEPSLTRPEAALTGFVLAVAGGRVRNNKQSLGTFTPAVALAYFDWLIDANSSRRPIALLRASFLIDVGVGSANDRVSDCQ